MRTEHSFDTATGRWHVVNTDRSPKTPFTEELPGVWVSRAEDGQAAECLVADDVLRAGDVATRAFVTDEFGIDPGGLVMPRTQPARTLGIDKEPVDRLPATRAIREPGIPYAHPDGSVHVPTEFGDIRVAASDAVLMIDVPVRASYEWVRISDAATGRLLALGRVTPLGSGFGANVTFGLDDSDIHITLTDTPLDPVADRRSRRIDWIDAVLAESRGRWWRHPLRSRAAARDAVAVASTLGDTRRAAEARRYARLVPAYFGLASVTLLAMATLGIKAAIPENVPALVVDGSLTATYGFGSGESANVTVDVDTTGSLTMVLSDTVAGSYDFGRAHDSDGTAGDAPLARCIAARDAWVESAGIPAVSASYTVSLRSGISDPILLGTVTMSSEADQMTTTPDDCWAAVKGSEGSFVARVIHQRSTEEFVLSAPEGINTSATWVLAIERAVRGMPPVNGDSAAPLRFRVDQ